MQDHMNTSRKLDDAFFAFRCGVAVVAMLVVAGLGLGGVLLCAAF